MKKVASSVYENLTVRQRVAASIAAQARSDEDERIRLIKNCPKVTYLQNDIKYSETMEKLMGLAMAVECDLRGFALAFFVGIRLDPKYALNTLQPYSDLRAAWQATLSDMGIDPEAMEKAGPPASPILELVEDIIPKPDRKKAKDLAADMKDLFE